MMKTSLSLAKFKNKKPISISVQRLPNYPEHRERDCGREVLPEIFSILDRLYNQFIVQGRQTIPFKGE